MARCIVTGCGLPLPCPVRRRVGSEEKCLFEIFGMLFFFACDDFFSVKVFFFCFCFFIVVNFLNRFLCYDGFEIKLNLFFIDLKINLSLFFFSIVYLSLFIYSWYSLSFIIVNICSFLYCG